MIKKIICKLFNHKPIHVPLLHGGGLIYCERCRVKLTSHYRDSSADHAIDVWKTEQRLRLK